MKISINKTTNNLGFENNHIAMAHNPKAAPVSPIRLNCRPTLITMILILKLDWFDISKIFCSEIMRDYEAVLFRIAPNILHRRVFE